MRTTRRLAAAALAAATGVATLAMTTPAAQAARTPTCGGVRATIVGTPGDDRLRGTPQRDVVVARGGDDVVRGLRGNDVICGGPGRDRLLGQGGSDRLFGQRDADTLLGGVDAELAAVEGVDMRGDTLDGGPGSDVLAGGRDPRHRRLADVTSVAVPDRISFRSARHGVRVDLARGRRADGVARGAGRDRIRWQPVLGVVGTRYDDHIDGGRMAPRVDALAGDDRVTAYVRGPKRAGPAAYRSTVWGGPGTDAYTPRYHGRGAYEVDARYGLVQFDEPAYGRGRNTATAAGFERWDLRAYAVGRVRFLGSRRADTVLAGRAPLEAVMRRGDDVVRLGAGRDAVDGGPGSDTVTGARAGDSCTAVERGDCG